MGTSTWTYVWKHPLELQPQRIADLGFRYVELTTLVSSDFFPRELNEKKRKDLRELFDSFNLRVREQ